MKKNRQGFALGVFGAGNVGESVTKLIGPTLITMVPVAGLMSGMIPGGWRFVPVLYTVLLVVMALGGSQCLGGTGGGIAHDAANVYWIVDGMHGNIIAYDFVEDHGPGNDDHSDARLRLFLLSRHDGGDGPRSGKTI